MLAICRESARETDEKRCFLVSVLALAAFVVLEETTLARSYLSCLTKKVLIVHAPKGTTSLSAEENFGFWIDEPTKIVTFADGRCATSSFRCAHPIGYPRRERGSFFVRPLGTPPGGSETLQRVGPWRYFEP